MTDKNVLRVISLLFSILLSSATQAVEEYTFTAPPRGNEENEAKVYQPIANYLSKATGTKIVYKHSDNWLSYQDGMRKGAFDIVFDGPHFVSWRMANLKHVPLAKLAGNLAFVVAVRKDNKHIHNIKDLAGRTVCGLAPPNLATLTLYGQFPNPVRQPLVLEAESFEQAYKNMLEGKCTAAVMRDKMLEKLNKDKDSVRVVFHSPGMPNQAFSVGPRLPTEARYKIAAALTSPDARKQLPQFFDRYSKDKDLISANDIEFRGLIVLLKDTWGF
ncbi:MAG TPA: PhnD/SsuA/transferrin family substrate-binding protein [Sulfuricaulis sp.]